MEETIPFDDLSLSLMVSYNASQSLLVAWASLSLMSLTHYQ